MCPRPGRNRARESACVHTQQNRLLDLDFSPGEETLELKLLDEGDIPWNQIAFATVRNTLTHYFEDRRAGAFGFHASELLKR